MPAYIVAQMKVHDIETYREYAVKVAPTFAAFGGKLLAANDNADVREGTQPFPRTVLVEFPDMEAARAWYGSGDYQEIAPLRQAASRGTLFIIEGVSIPDTSSD
ncbi:MAG: DUF1330 domain-containing protein [Chloroflexi bacterium]|nr:DUF1330 domain-containing protein [Chloroflexota bacterium]